jgi:hypothetical protein
MIALSLLSRDNMTMHKVKGKKIRYVWRENQKTAQNFQIEECQQRIA